MGKRDNRFSFVNPLSIRSSGSTSTAPTIQDYLNRPRPTWDEIKKKMEKFENGCGTLALFEDKINENYRKTLKKRRKKLIKENEKERKMLKKKLAKKKKSKSSSFDSSSSSYEVEHKSRKKQKKNKKKKRSKSSSSDTDADQSRPKKSKLMSEKWTERRHQAKPKTKKGVSSYSTNILPYQPTPSSHHYDERYDDRDDSQEKSKTSPTDSVCYDNVLDIHSNHHHGDFVEETDDSDDGGTRLKSVVGYYSNNNTCNNVVYDELHVNKATGETTRKRSHDRSEKMDSQTESLKKKAKHKKKTKHKKHRKQ